MSKIGTQVSLSFRPKLVLKSKK